MHFEEQIKQAASQALKELYCIDIEQNTIQLQKTKKEFEADFTLVVFPFVKASRLSPQQTAQQLGEKMQSLLPQIQSFSVINGFLNITFDKQSWLEWFYTFGDNFLSIANAKNEAPVVVEFSSPNTNKPLHLGHVRNNLLGASICNILEAVGNKVIRVNLVNDRGIHICKSMVAWQNYAHGETPQSSALKGDKLIGNYYVLFDKEYKKQVNELIDKGLTQEEAEKEAPIMQQARQMLKDWENDTPDVKNLWKQMNEWAYSGFEQTYQQLGIYFDKIYYESQTYLLGKELVKEGLQKGIFEQHEDGSVRVNLTADGLDEKVLLRSDGTSVYITQDLGTAVLRATEFHPKKMIYIVGNEQNYHFDVLKLILTKKMGFEWANSLYHLSYGMVELPSGKMKSREGTVVDADDLMADMQQIATENMQQLGKSDNFDDLQMKNLAKMIGLGALKYFILKVDPKKNMLFNPEESIDLNGNTAPFIQYTHARICSLLNKADKQQIDISKQLSVNELPSQEKELLRSLYEYQNVVEQAANELNPSLIANYIYETVKIYNHFYQQTPILRENDEILKTFRLQLSDKTAKCIQHSMRLLGIDVPQKM
ncbi:MAG: arginine--tRNA ligase [Bacteroidales bacterium]|jgi:arginyl-tRNA synthetase|nr:arginine--tRNA ligase [Bacteroidales bacterium]